VANYTPAVPGAFRLDISLALGAGSASAPQGGLKVEYFTNAWLLGAPSRTGVAAFAEPWVADSVYSSARWSGLLRSSGLPGRNSWSLTVGATDGQGARLYVNGALVIDALDVGAVEAAAEAASGTPRPASVLRTSEALWPGGMTLARDTLYDVRIEWHGTPGAGTLMPRWLPPSGSTAQAQPIPPSSLFFGTAAISGSPFSVLAT
jgi:hypothetical protein